jgi:CheY-like chemotaxis protein
MTSEPEPQMLDILVVDDNDDDVVLLRESLRDQPAARLLGVARDGEEALAFLRREGDYTAAPRPGLVLLDINMPRKNGFEVLSEMKEDPLLRGIPVIVLTTSRRDADVREAYTGGACSFVSKPVNLDRFRLMARHFVAYWSTVARLPKAEG